MNNGPATGRNMFVAGRFVHVNVSTALLPSDLPEAAISGELVSSNDYYIAL